MKRRTRRALTTTLAIILTVALLPLPGAEALAFSDTEAAGEDVFAAQTYVTSEDAEAAEVFSEEAETESASPSTVIDIGTAADYTLDLDGGAKILSFDSLEGKTKISWSASPKGIVSVKKKSTTQVKVTPKKKGKATIKVSWKCKTENRRESRSYTVEVVDHVSIDTSSVQLVPGENLQLWLDNADVSKVKWSSSKKKIATVKKKTGMITAKKVGTTTITGTYKKRKYKCTVTVVKTAALNKLKTGKITKNIESSGGVMGDLGNDNYEVNIPAGTFENDTEVSITVGKKNILSIKAKDKPYMRLKEPVTVRMNLDGPVPNDELDRWVGVYYFGKKKYYTEPDKDMLRAGILQYEIYHFSDHGAERMDDAAMTAYVAYKEALLDASKDAQNDVVSEVMNAVFEGVFKQIGVDEEKSEKLMKRVTRGTKLFALARAAYEGDESAFTSEAVNAIVRTLAEDADKDGGYFSAVAGSLPEVAEAIKKGDTAAAGRAVLEAVANNVPVKKYADIAISICSTTIDYYIDSETDAAYKAYKGLLESGECGYDGKINNWGWEMVTQQMACPLRQMKTKALQEYAKACNCLVSEISAEDNEKIEKMVEANLKKQFEKRSENEKEIAKRQKETEEFFAALKKEGLLERGDMSVAFDRDDDMEIRLNRLLNLRESIKNIIKTKYNGKSILELENAKGFGTVTDEMKRDIENRRLAKLIAVWVENGWTTENGGPAGRKALLEELERLYENKEEEEEEEEVNQDSVKLNWTSYEFSVYMQQCDLKLYKLKDPKEKDQQSNREYLAIDNWTLTGDCVMMKQYDNDKEVVYIKALCDGEATVSCIYGGKSYSCKFTVKDVGTMLNAGSLNIEYDGKKDPYYGYQGMITIECEGTEGALPIDWDSDGVQRGIVFGGASDGNYQHVRVSSPKASSYIVLVRSNSLKKVIKINVTIEDTGNDGTNKLIYYTLNLNSGSLNLKPSD